MTSKSDISRNAVWVRHVFQERRERRARLTREEQQIIRKETQARLAYDSARWALRRKLLRLRDWIDEAIEFNQSCREPSAAACALRAAHGEVIQASVEVLENQIERLNDCFLKLTPLA